jgi:hypothetical protein
VHDLHQQVRTAPRRNDEGAPLRRRACSAQAVGNPDSPRTIASVDAGLRRIDDRCRTSFSTMRARIRHVTPRPMKKPPLRSRRLLRAVLLVLPALLMLPACTGFPGSTRDVSGDPRVATYLQEPRQLIESCDLLGEGRGSILVEHGTRNFRNGALPLRQVLPCGTRVELARIHRIQGDGFVLFQASGKAFPAGHPAGLPFTYRWGYGGTSPRAPWEPAGQRLKKQLGLE